MEGPSPEEPPEDEAAAAAAPAAAAAAALAPAAAAAAAALPPAAAAEAEAPADSQLTRCCDCACASYALCELLMMQGLCRNMCGTNTTDKDRCLQPESSAISR